MLQRKYMYLIARAIGRPNTSRQYRGLVAQEMLNWMLEDNPAMNVKAFRVLSRTEPGVDYDVQDYNSDTD